MRPSGVVERQIPADRRAGIADRGISPKIDLLVFDRAPQALNKHVVPPGAPAIHADRDLLALEDRGEADTRELTALVGIEDVGLAEARQRFLQSLDAEVRRQRDRQPSGQHPPTEPVNDGDEVDELARHRDMRATLPPGSWQPVDIDRLPLKAQRRR